VRQSELIVYIDRSNIRDGRLEEVKTAIEHLVEFVNEHNPRIIDYRFFVEEKGGRLTLVAVHPDSAALEFHMDVGNEEFRKLAPMIALRSIEVFGRPSERVMNQLQEKADMLGENGTVSVHEHFTGFTRIR
jgi:hypothetical protein